MEEFELPCSIAIVTDYRDKNPRLVVSKNNEDIALFVTKSDIKLVGKVKRFNFDGRKKNKLNISKFDIEDMKEMTCSIISKRYKQMGINVKTIISRKKINNKSKKIRSGTPDDKKPKCECYMELGIDAHLLFDRCPAHGNNKRTKQYD